MRIRFYNTLTKRLEDFEPLEGGVVRMYNCGPTVHDYAHIGNFRAFVFADLLRRFLEFKGFEVRQVMNITDVGHMLEDADIGEDKLEIKAREAKKDPWQIAEFYTRAFFEDIDKLNIRPAMHYPRATEHIREMIEIVVKLIERGHAYVVNNSVYYDVRSFPAYGRLSGNTLEDLEAGARIEPHPDKRHPFDFALWIHNPRHIMQWDSPWGRGYPGWHIECCAMSIKYLGETLDIHTGGEDNIFPHHECEIAQAEGATGKTFVRYWLHNRHMFVEGRKMSKSLGNFYTLRDLLEMGYSPRAIRYLLLSTNYRQPLNFTFDGLESAQQAVWRLDDLKDRLKSITEPGSTPAIQKRINSALGEFESCLDDDLNISGALGALFSLVRELNKARLKLQDAKLALKALWRVNEILGVLDMEREDQEIDKESKQLIQKREKARRERNFAEADAIRQRLIERGVLIEDTPSGTRWRIARWRRRK